jgi:aldose 1-epimerase
MSAPDARSRASALLASPGGSALLLILDEGDTPPGNLATPDVGLAAIIQAVAEISPWRSPGHDHILRTVFDYRDRHRARLELLALDLVNQPGIAWMWEGVDLANQLWLPQETGWVDRDTFEAGRAGQEGDWLDPYPHQPWPLLSTSNRHGDISPELAHILGHGGDWILRPPIERRAVTIRSDARVLEIATPRDWHDFIRRYPADGFRKYRNKPNAYRYEDGHPWGYAPELMVPDWHAASADWDGVNVSPWAYLTVIQVREQSDIGWTEPWAWEGPHTTWLNWVFETVEDLPPIEEDPATGGSQHFWMPQALNFTDPYGMKMMANPPTGGWSMQRGITREPFGEIDGQAIERYTLTNDHGMSVSILTYGGIIQSLHVPDRHGHITNVALGCADLDTYRKHSPYFGAIVGRYANRIANGHFTLDGETYTLPQNNGPNTLHGGIKGFDRQIWTAEAIETEIGPVLTLRYTSPDGEEGFPSNLDVTVSCHLSYAVNALHIMYFATTDAPTVINLSNHSYFNLAGEGSGDILRHAIQLRASHYLPVNDTLIPTGELAPVAGTPFDFTEAHLIGERIDQPGDAQLAIAGGYDHCFVFDTIDDLGFDPSYNVRVIDPGSGRMMDVSTDQPAVQFYTGNQLTGDFPGTSGSPYPRNTGFCLETQHYPDSPNQPDFPSTVLLPGEPGFHSHTTYSFGII